MVQPAPMAKDKTFNLRLDEADRERLDRVAQHFACSAAVAIRLLIKMKFDELEKTDPFLSDTARKTGISPRVVAEGVRVGEMPEEVLSVLRGSSIEDNHEALLSLTRLPEDELIALAKKGPEALSEAARLLARLSDR